MNLLQQETITILSLKKYFNLEQVKTDKFYLENNTLYIQLTKLTQTCPKCGSSHCHVNGYYNRKIKTSPINQKQLFLDIKQRRYRCVSCNKKFIEHNPIVNKYAKISNICISNILNDLKELQSFSTIAKRYNLSPTSVINILKNIKMPGEIKLPKAISIDEIKFRNRYPKYSFVLYNHCEHSLITLLDNRRYDSILEQLKQIPKEEREKVEFVSIDLWKPYKLVIKKIFPNAIITSDKFHYTRYVANAILNLRIRIMNLHNKKSDEYKALKYNWKLFSTRFEKLEGFCFNYLSRKTTTKKSFIQDCLMINNEFKEGLELYNYYLDITNNSYPKEIIPSLLKEWIKKLKLTNIREFKALLTTFENWYTEICNSLIYKDRNNKTYSNGAIEGFNNVIKTYKKIGFGYSNFENFNRRLILISNKINNILFV